MTRLRISSLLVLPLAMACGDPTGLRPRSGRPGPGAMALPNVDAAHGARTTLSGWLRALAPLGALDLAQQGPKGPASIRVGEGWTSRGGGSVAALGGAPQWSRVIGEAGWDSAMQVVRYDADEVAVVGFATDGTVFGGACGTLDTGEREPGVPFLYASYVARFDDSGACTWMASFGSDDAWPTAVAVDAAGDLFVVGQFNERVDFGGAFDLATAENAYDVFVARWDSVGALSWATSITGPSDTWAYDAAVVEDGDGADLVLVGSYDGTLALGATTLVSAGGYDMLVARYSSAGAVAFASGFGGSGEDELYAVAVASGTLVAGGYFNSATLPLGDAGTHASAGGFDAALVGFHGAGAPLWALSFGGDGDDYVYDLTDAGGDVAAVGSFSGTLSIGGLGALSSNETSMFVAKLSAAGSAIWSHAVRSTNGVAYATSVRSCGSGDVYVAGVIDGEAALGDTVLTPAAGSWSIVAARYTSAGAATPLWAAQKDGSSSIPYPVLGLTDGAVVLAADSTGNGGDIALYALEP